jgi:hypothetical protein
MWALIIYSLIPLLLIKGVFEEMIEVFHFWILNSSFIKLIVLTLDTQKHVKYIFTCFEHYLFLVVMFDNFTHEYNMLDPIHPPPPPELQSSPLTSCFHFSCLLLLDGSSFLIYTLCYYLGWEFDIVPRCLLFMYVKDCAWVCQID